MQRTTSLYVAFCEGRLHETTGGEDRVVDADDASKEYGEIADVFKTGANDVYTVKNPSGEFLVPVIDEVVVEKDIDGGEIKIRPLKGIFEDED